ncbi:hypothetical protein ACTXT7_014714 [Hymenolepis weldensis]
MSKKFIRASALNNHNPVPRARNLKTPVYSDLANDWCSLMFRSHSVLLLDVIQTDIAYSAKLFKTPPSPYY